MAARRADENSTDFTGQDERASSTYTYDVRSPAGTTSAVQLKLPRVPDAFPDDEASVPNNPLIVTGLEAIYKGGPRASALVGGWSEGRNGLPVYQHEAKAGRILVYPTLVGPSEPMPTTESVWAFVGGLSAFTSDVALAVLAQLCEPTTGDKPKYPHLQSVIITADAILGYKGIRRYGEERRELERRVYEEMRRLQALTFDVEKLPAPDPNTGKWNNKGASWRKDRLFDIVEAQQWRERRSGERETVEVSWSVRLGQWAQFYLNAEGTIWLARMAQALLELDHREVRGREYMAKKLGQRLVLMHQALNLSKPLSIRVENVLEKVGELPVHQYRGGHWARRTRERFDDALLTLQESGVFRSVHWPDGYGPGDGDYGRGWVEKWLAAKVEFTLPEQAPDLPARSNRAFALAGSVSDTARRTPNDRFDGTALRTARTDRGWSQEGLAKELGISVAWLSKIEGGKKQPSRKLVDNIFRWMQRSQ